MEVMINLEPTLVYWTVIALKFGSLYLLVRVIGFVALTFVELSNAYEIKKQNKTLDTIIEKAKAGHSEKEGLYTGRGSGKDN